MMIILPVHGMQILIRGNKSTTDGLAEHCRTNIPQVSVFVPRLNELLDATTDSHIYQVSYAAVM